jgi:hypothetical protein
MGMAKSLLVCSVFAGTNLDSFWYQLQQTYLRRTSVQFNHAVFLGSRADPACFNRSIIVGQSRGAPGAREHLEGLHALSEYARTHSYDCYLVLDSDAFPIKANWQSILEDRLNRFNKRYAAAVRTENFDVFPHPCIVYSINAKDLSFGREPTPTIQGGTVRDIRCLSQNYLALIRTNAVSLHPLLASVYANVFYHHGCGSRVFLMRSAKSGYYDDILSKAVNPEELFVALRRNPETFINHLTYSEKPSPDDGRSSGYDIRENEDKIF